MTDTAAPLLSKAWARGILIIVGASPSVALVWFQEALTPFMLMLGPVVLLRSLAALLMTTLTLMVYATLLRPWLKWDASTGTWINRRDGIRYCGTCRAKKIIVPLRTDQTGWRCVVCNGYAHNPECELKTPVSRTLIKGAALKRGPGLDGRF